MWDLFGHVDACFINKITTNYTRIAMLSRAFAVALLMMATASGVRLHSLNQLAVADDPPAAPAPDAAAKPADAP